MLVYLAESLLTRSFPLSRVVLDLWGTELVYAVPNDCRSGLLNAEDVHGQVLLVNRGEVRTAVGTAKTDAIDSRPVLREHHSPIL